MLTRDYTANKSTTQGLKPSPPRASRKTPQRFAQQWGETGRQYVSRVPDGVQWEDDDEVDRAAVERNLSPDQAYAGGCGSDSGSMDCEPPPGLGRGQSDGEFTFTQRFD